MGLCPSRAYIRLQAQGLHTKMLPHTSPPNYGSGKNDSIDKNRN